MNDQSIFAMFFVCVAFVIITIVTNVNINSIVDKKLTIAKVESCQNSKLE